MASRVLLDLSHIRDRSGSVADAKLAAAPEVASEARSRGDYVAWSTALGAVALMLATLAGDDLVLHAETADLKAMRVRLAAEQVSAADEKYLRQRACNTYRK